MAGDCQARLPDAASVYVRIACPLHSVRISTKSHPSSMMPTELRRIGSNSPRSDDLHRKTHLYGFGIGINPWVLVRFLSGRGGVFTEVMG